MSSKGTPPSTSHSVPPQSAVPAMGDDELQAWVRSLSQASAADIKLYFDSGTLHALAKDVGQRTSTAIDEFLVDPASLIMSKVPPLDDADVEARERRRKEEQLQLLARIREAAAETLPPQSKEAVLLRLEQEGLLAKILADTSQERNVPAKPAENQQEVASQESRHSRRLATWATIAGLVSSGLTTASTAEQFAKPSAEPSVVLVQQQDSTNQTVGSPDFIRREALRKLLADVSTDRLLELVHTSYPAVGSTDREELINLLLRAIKQ